MVVADRGPLIHLSIVQQFSLLQQIFHQVSTIPQVVDEVVTQGKGRPGEADLEQGMKDGWASYT